MEIVNKMPKAKSSQGVAGCWDFMTDGKARKFTKGVDFDCSAARFRMRFITFCCRRRWQGVTRVDGSDVYLQYLGPKK